MKTLKISLALSTFLLTQVSAMEGGGTDRFHTYNNSSIKDAMAYYDKLKNQDKVDPSNILVIFDVDGTLTNHGNPLGEHTTKFGPRGKAVDFVKELSKDHAKIVASSAWSSPDRFGVNDEEGFKQTLKRLKKLGLTQEFNTAKQEKNCTKAEEFGESLDVCKNGSVVSVRYSKNIDSDDPFFRQKAFSYKFSEPQIDSNAITHVIFLDDSSGNIRNFKDDMPKTDLYQNPRVQFSMFSLTIPDKEPKD